MNDYIWHARGMTSVISEERTVQTKLLLEMRIKSISMLLRLTFSIRSTRSVLATYCCQAQYLVSYRLDVLIHPEEVRRVVLFLELH